MIKKVCKWCGEPFEARRNALQFCSRVCYRESTKRYKACPRCGKQFIGQTMFCSVECARPNARVRFDESFEKDPDTDCWNWTKYVSPEGYGHFVAGGITTQAHRYAWMRANGPIPEGMQVLHRCNNPRCVNPSHLYLGDYFDNIHDCINAGTYKKPEKKLTYERAQAIRRRAATYQGSQRELAQQLGISRQHLNAILNFKCWTEEKQGCGGRPLK